jgi:hypothetical protein
VFGDGSVTTIATPGHTPGHQSTLASLQTIATILEERKAQLWINHNKPEVGRSKRPFAATSYLPETFTADRRSITVMMTLVSCSPRPAASAACW